MPDPHEARIDAYIGIGSNLGDPIDHVLYGIRELGHIADTDCVAHSSLYASPPMGPPQQPDYVNAVAWLETRLAPLDLLDALHTIELAHGRVRGEHWGARTLDLDILLYGDRRINCERLVVPHSGLHERAFVLYPLLELAGEIEIPGRGSLHSLVDRCPRGELKRLENLE